MECGAVPFPESPPALFLREAMRTCSAHAPTRRRPRRAAGDGAGGDENGNAAEEAHNDPDPDLGEGRHEDGADQEEAAKKKKAPSKLAAKLGIGGLGQIPLGACMQ
jgi:hypothetical protein